MHQTMEGPREGIGAKLVWSGNDKVGSGTQVISAATPDRSVASDLDFGKMGRARAAIDLLAQGTSTRVTWSVDMDMGAGPGIDGEMTSTRFTFQAGMPVDRSDVSPGDNVRG
jgi:hypothetical protein